MSERKLRAYLGFKKTKRARKARKEFKKYGPDQMHFGQNIPQGVLDRVKYFNDKYSSAFASSNALPPPLKGIDAHKIKFKPGKNTDWKPPKCKEPRWTPAAKQILTEWTIEKLAQGLIEKATGSEYCSRIHIAGKGIAGEPKSGEYDVRFCGDFKLVNECIQKSVPNYPKPLEQIEQATGHKYFWSADGKDQFHSVPMDEASRDATTFWTPMGKMRYKRMPFGLINSATIAQGHYRDIMNNNLTPSQLQALSNFQDDFCGYANDLYELAEHWGAFLHMCATAGITLNADKCHFGIERVVFYGHEIDKDGHRQTERNLDPIDKMVEPENISQARTVMGLFNTGLSRVKDFGIICKPLHKLTSNKHSFEWTEECQNAFDTIRKSLLKRNVLRKPNYDWPFYLDVDASDDGKGGCLYQLHPETNEKLIIAWWSKAWGHTMRGRPPYYKEAEALFWCLEKKQGLRRRITISRPRKN